MKTQNHVALLFLTLLLVACTSPSPATAPPNNFAFVFQFSPCGPTPMYVLDTTQNSLVYTPLGEKTSTTLSLRLEEEDLQSIEREVNSIDFFEYPSEFVIPENEILAYVSSASVYELRVITDDLTHSVSWVDNAMAKPGYRQAEDLRELMRHIVKIIRSHPAVQQLPAPNAACA